MFILEHPVSFTPVLTKSWFQRPGCVYRLKVQTHHTVLWCDTLDKTQAEMKNMFNENFFLEHPVVMFTVEANILPPNQTAYLCI